MDDSHWIVNSTSGLVTDGYRITKLCNTCTECTSGQGCSDPECGFLCRHMYICDERCYDYGNGHICKHIHRVHSLQQHYDTSEAVSDHSPVLVFYPPDDDEKVCAGSKIGKGQISMKFNSFHQSIFVRSPFTSTYYTKTFG